MVGLRQRCGCKPSNLPKKMLWGKRISIKSFEKSKEDQKEEKVSQCYGLRDLKNRDWEIVVTMNLVNSYKNVWTIEVNKEGMREKGSRKTASA